MQHTTIHKIVLLPFILCVRFLQLLGKCFGLSYERISVIFNLYLQGGILLLSGALPLMATAWTMTGLTIGWGITLLITSIVYLSIYIVGFITLLKHYHPPMDDAFNLCVNDLLWIAGKWHVSYHAVNLVIFVLWWLALIGMNILAACSILKFGLTI
ncbi:MAG: hypothetical protein IKP43_07750 [Bacteroidaceae bacterium]|nr:hypothetical protein [Bacteroidaceae bacterium]